MVTKEKSDLNLGKISTKQFLLCIKIWDEQTSKLNENADSCEIVSMIQERMNFIFLSIWDDRWTVSKTPVISLKFTYTIELFNKYRRSVVFSRMSPQYLIHEKMLRWNEWDSFHYLVFLSYSNQTIRLQKLRNENKKIRRV